MNDVVNSINSPVETITVTDVANKEAHPLVTLKKLRHLPLLHLIARVDDDALRVELFERHRHKSVAEGAGSSSHQDGGL